MSELLSISIPTWNRARYLGELLESIRSNLTTPASAAAVKVYIHDNASTDDTAGTVNRSGLAVVYRRHELNIGGDANILKAYTEPAGKYIWVIGDDELVPAGALEYLLSLLAAYEPGLIVNRSAGYEPFVNLALRYSDYRAVCDLAVRHNPHLLIAHSLISANIVRRDCFDAGLAAENINYNYGPCYGLARGLKRSGAPVLFAQHDTLIIRSERADFPGKNEAYVRLVEGNQVRYLRWLKDEYQLTGLRPERVLADHAWKVKLDLLRRQPLKGLASLTYSWLFMKLKPLRPALAAVQTAYRASPLGPQKAKT